MGKEQGALLAALRRFGEHGLELLQLRLALLGTELEAEKLRLFAALLGALAALLLGGMALGLLSLGLVLLSPDGWRWLAALGLGLAYLALAWLLWRQARGRLSASGGLFAGSLAEFRRDREELRDDDDEAGGTGDAVRR